MDAKNVIVEDCAIPENAVRFAGLSVIPEIPQNGSIPALRVSNYL